MMFFIRQNEPDPAKRTVYLHFPGWDMGIDGQADIIMPDGAVVSAGNVFSGASAGTNQYQSTCPLVLTEKEVASRGLLIVKFDDGTHADAVAVHILGFDPYAVGVLP